MLESCDPLKVSRVSVKRRLGAGAGAGAGEQAGVRCSFSIDLLTSFTRPFCRELLNPNR